MATSAGIYLKHPSLTYGEELTRAVDAAVHPLLPFGARPGDPKAVFDIRMSAPASFDFPGTRAVIHITGKPPEARVALTRSIAKLLAKAGFDFVIEDEEFGELKVEH